MNRRERITDELLVLRCQEADQAAFAELVDRWSERLWRHAWRLTGDEQAAWDTTQEAWIDIARRLDRLVDAAAFGAWAYRIASNKCRDWVRRRGRQRRADEAYAVQVERDERDARTTVERAADLDEALARLSGRNRAILSLRYEEGFDTAEIADILGIPAGTVKSRLYYARKRLRGYLEEDDDE